MSVKSVQEVAAVGATFVSGGSASWAWLSNVNEILTLIATLIAIVSGLYAIRYYSKKKDEPDSE